MKRTHQPTAIENNGIDTRGTGDDGGGGARLRDHVTANCIEAIEAIDTPAGGA